MDLIRDAMNSTVPGSARYTQYTGGHCCWNTWYNPAWTENGESIYTWMMKTQSASGPQVTNAAPVVNAGVNQTISLPLNTVNLTGSATDADGNIAAYAWTKIAGPAQFTIVSPGAASTAVNNLVQGTYQFELRVTDNSLAVARDTVSVTVNANSCGCNHVLTPGVAGEIYVDGKQRNFQPGDVVCISATSYSYISLQNVVGTAANPITIKNCGGQVISTGSNGNYGFRLIKSRFVKVTGTGSAAHTYGFKIDGGPLMISSGVAVADSSSDLEIDHFDVRKASAGFIMKTNPTNCNPGSWDGYFTVRNISLHDNYLHNIGGEGFYIGHTSYTVSVLDCSGNTITVEPQKIRNVKIFNNTTDTTGWDGIQLASAPENAEIYNNVVRNFGTAGITSQQAGIILGGKTTGKVYNNYVFQGTGSGIQVFGFDSVKVYNNIVVNAGQDGTAVRQDGIFIDDRPAPGYGGLRVLVMNNTVVNAGRNAIRMQNTYGSAATGNIFQNNLCVAPAGLPTNPTGYIVIGAGINVANTNNINRPTIPEAGFVNPGLNNYALAAGSPAVDAGINLSSHGVVSDYGTLPRPQGTTYDAGAFELPSSPPPNQAPTAQAGTDQTITLPTNSVSLTGSGIDTDGNITGYSWTKISGPATFNIVTPATAQTTINNLVQGVYEFRLVVTDNGGLTGADTVRVTVNIPPVANAGSDRSMILPQESLLMNGNGSDADGIIVSYFWTKISGPSNYTIVTPGDAQTRISGLVQGIYEFQLMVTDNHGGSDTDTVTVTVLPSTLNSLSYYGLKLYPNPVTDKVNLLMKFANTGEVFTIIIADQFGRTVYQSEKLVVSPDVMNKQIDLGYLVNGVYSLRCVFADSKIKEIKKFVKQ
jgi:Right handed beta helix region/Secretion system C-terminal sorting domain